MRPVLPARERGAIPDDEVLAAALLDRLLHDRRIVRHPRNRGELAPALHQAPARRNPGRHPGENPQATR